MKKLAVNLLLILVFFFSLLLPAQSESFTLAWPIEGKVGLKFGEKYLFEGKERTHYGIDILAAEGTEVKSPAEGEVVFSGQVAGRQAVTIEAEGFKLSLSPLKEVEVFKGEKIEKGGLIGKLAFEGDYSLAETHLHLSLRDSEGKYLDPLPYLPELNLEQTQPEKETQLVENETLTQPGPEPQSNPSSLENLVFIQPENAKEFAGNSVAGQDSASVETVQPGNQSQNESPFLQSRADSSVISWNFSRGEKSISNQSKLAKNSVTRALEAKKKSSFSFQATDLREKTKALSDTFCQRRAQGLVEMARHSQKNQELFTSPSRKGKSGFGSFNLAPLGWSFLVWPLFYAFFFYSWEEVPGRFLYRAGQVVKASLF